MWYNQSKLLLVRALFLGTSVNFSPRDNKSAVSQSLRSATPPTVLNCEQATFFELTISWGLISRLSSFEIETGPIRVISIFLPEANHVRSEKFSKLG